MINNMEGLIIVLLVLLVYFIPSIVAYNRQVKNRTSVLILNIFLGWTFVGWVIALVWAVKKD